MSCHTVIHGQNEVEVVPGDVSADPELQYEHGRGRFWVAVADNVDSAHRWAGIYREYLTARFRQRHRDGLLNMLIEGVPKQCIVPPQRTSDA